MHQKAKLARIGYGPSDPSRPLFHRKRIRIRVTGSPTRNRLSSASGVQIGWERARRKQTRKCNGPLLIRDSSFVFISVLPLRVGLSPPNNRGEWRRADTATYAN